MLCLLTSPIALPSSSRASLMLAWATLNLKFLSRTARTTGTISSSNQRKRLPRLLVKINSNSRHSLSQMPLLSKKNNLHPRKARNLQRKRRNSWETASFPVDMAATHTRCSSTTKTTTTLNQWAWMAHLEVPQLVAVKIHSIHRQTSSRAVDQASQAREEARSTILETKTLRFMLIFCRLSVSETPSIQRRAASRTWATWTLRIQLTWQSEIQHLLWALWATGEEHSVRAVAAEEAVSSWSLRKTYSSTRTKMPGVARLRLLKMHPIQSVLCWISIRTSTPQIMWR